MFRPSFVAISIGDILHFCPSILLGLFYPIAVSKILNLSTPFSIQEFNLKSNGIRSGASLRQSWTWLWVDFEKWLWTWKPGVCCHTKVVNLNTSLKPIIRVSLILEIGPKVRDQTRKFLWTGNVKRRWLTDCSLYIFRNNSKSIMSHTTVIFKILCVFYVFPPTTKSLLGYLGRDPL